MLTRRRRTLWIFAAACGIFAATVAPAQSPAPQTATPGAAPIATSPYHVLSTTTATTGSQPPKAMPTVSSRPMPIDLGRPYVTTCLVSVIAEPARAKTGAAFAATVVKTIEQTCGPKISNVQVKITDGNKATVHLTAPTAEEARVFWDKIQAMPELKSYRLDVEAKVRQ